jgi:hypothetical protein
MARYMWHSLLNLMKVGGCCCIWQYLNWIMLAGEFDGVITMEKHQAARATLWFFKATHP